MTAQRPARTAALHNGHAGLRVFLDPAAAKAAMAQDVRLGLTSRPKFLLPKYFYDSAGSALFEQITLLPEYYPTRAEQEILAGWAAEVMARVRPAELVELGSGSMAKANMLLSCPEGIRSVRRFVPFDVDETVVRAAIEHLALTRPHVDVQGVVGDFERHLGHLETFQGRGMVVFFGSTIGNLHPPERVALLQEVRGILGVEGRLLLGIDLVKDVHVLELAYDDPAGVTAAFNRNILRVMNNALGADFRPDAYAHRALYNGQESRIEMHLTATSPQTVTVPGAGVTVDIAGGESIWTESSYKFTRASASAMLAEAGLRLEAWKTDRQARFALLLAAPA